MCSLEPPARDFAISDHSAIVVDKSLKRQKTKPNQISFRNYKAVDWERLGHLSFQAFDSQYKPSLSIHDLASFLSKNTRKFLTK
jgi:hypothetical protein